MQRKFRNLTFSLSIAILCLTACEVKTLSSAEANDDELLPVSELAEVAAFCRKHAGVKVYKKIATDRLRLGSSGCPNNSCMRLLATNQISYIESEVKTIYNSDYIYLTSAPGPGKYRFSMSDNGDPNCASFQRIREKNKTDTRVRVPLPIPYEKCIAAEPITDFAADYSFETIRGERQGREDGEKIAFKRSAEQIVHIETGEVVAEGIVYNIYLGTHGLSYGMGIEGGGVGLVKCQGDGSIFGFLEKVILPE